MLWCFFFALKIPSDLFAIAVSSQVGGWRDRDGEEKEVKGGERNDGAGSKSEFGIAFKFEFSDQKITHISFIFVQ